MGLHGSWDLNPGLLSLLLCAAYSSAVTAGVFGQTETTTDATRRICTVRPLTRPQRSRLLGPLIPRGGTSTGSRIRTYKAPTASGSKPPGLAYDPFPVHGLPEICTRSLHLARVLRCCCARSPQRAVGPVRLSRNRPCTLAATSYSWRAARAAEACLNAVGRSRTCKPLQTTLAFQPSGVAYLLATAHTVSRRVQSPVCLRRHGGSERRR
jgi:hypothetical protein